MSLRWPLPLIGAAVLAGCATTPVVETHLSSAVPDGVTTYHLVQVETPTAPDLATVEAVRQALTARGWIETDSKAAWRVETAYAVRPQKTGAFTDADARQGEWTEAPRLPQWWSRGRDLHRLTVILTGPGDQTNVYRASASAVLTRRQAGSGPSLLAEAATGSLQLGD